MKTTVIKQIKNDKGQIVSVKRIRTVPVSRLIADLGNEINKISDLLKDEKWPESTHDAGRTARNTLKRVIRMIKSY